MRFAGNRLSKRQARRILIPCLSVCLTSIYIQILIPPHPMFVVFIVILQVCICILFYCYSLSLYLYPVFSFFQFVFVILPVLSSQLGVGGSGYSCVWGGGGGLNIY